METTTSFAPLAGRLAAKVAEIRPAEGAAVSWANFMALFFCAIFEMLILLCETLDARAAAEAAGLVAAPAAPDAHARPVLAARPGHAATSRARPVLRLVRADDATVMPLARDAAQTQPDAPRVEGYPLAWSPPWPEVCWRPPRFTVLSRNEAFLTNFSMSVLLRYNNEMEQRRAGKRRNPNRCRTRLDS